MRSVAAASLVLFCACSAPPIDVPSPEHGRRAGALLELEPLDRFGALGNRLTLRLAGIQGEFAHSIDTYHMTYVSLDATDRPIVATGLVAIPDTDAPLGLVSWQHGTTTTKTAVPSSLNFEGTMTARVFAGLGYVLVAPDYQGLGGSTGQHPYLVASTAANDVQFAIAAAERVLERELPVHLIGFSQGGHATLAALKRLEEAGEVALDGAVAIAGPHNLRRISFPVALSGRSVNDSLYLAYMTLGYAHAYGHDASTVLRGDMVAKVPTLLDGAHTAEAIVAGLPKNPRELFSDEFLSAFDHDHSNWLLDALRDNEVSHWQPCTPVLLLYGDDDVDVPPAEAIETAAEMSGRGARVSAQSVGPADHDASVFKAIPAMLDWLARDAPPS